MKTERALNAVVLDDELSQAQGMAASLERVGFKAKPVNRWTDAKSEMERMQTVDWLVIDNALKAEKSGIQFVSELRREGKVTVKRVLVATGHASALAPADAAAAKNWGMRVEPKPVDLARLAREEFPELKQRTSEPQATGLRARWKRCMAWCEEHQGCGQWTGVTIAVVVIIVPLLWAMLGRHGAGKQSGPSASLPEIQARLAINPVPLGSLAILADKDGTWSNAALRVEIISFPSGKAALDAVIGGGSRFRHGR